MNAESTDVLVLGRRGQLARALTRSSPQYPNLSLTFLGRSELDVADTSALRAAILEHTPNILVNATAYTAVDRAEDQPEAAFAINRDAVAVMGEAATKIGCPVIHVSTDYVFDGQGTRPYRPEDPTGPLSVYGASKLAGERALAAAQPQHVILRTSWLYAADGTNFMSTMLHLAESRDRILVVQDQLGCPTVADDLAEAILHICCHLSSGGDATWGVFHYCGEGTLSWHDFALAIFDEAARRDLPVAEVAPTTTAAFGAKAPRPAYSILDCERLQHAYGVTQKSWRDGLCKVLDQTSALRTGRANGRIAA